MGIDSFKDTKYKRQEETEKKIPLLNNEDDSSDDEELFERSRDAARLNSDGKITKVKNELDGAISIMRSNIGKVLDRGDKLEDLESKSEGFEMNAFNFNKSSKKLRNRMWWQNAKTKLILVLLFVGVLVVIIVSVVIRNKKE